MKSMGRVSDACAQGPSHSILLTQEISLYGDLVTTTSPNSTILTLKEKKEKRTLHKILWPDTAALCGYLRFKLTVWPV